MSRLEALLYDNSRREEAIRLYKEIKQLLDGIHFQKRELRLTDLPKEREFGFGDEDEDYDTGDYTEQEKRAGFQKNPGSSMSIIDQAAKEPKINNPQRYGSDLAPNPFKSNTNRTIQSYDDVDVSRSQGLRIFQNPVASNVRNSAKIQLSEQDKRRKPDGQYSLTVTGPSETYQHETPKKWGARSDVHQIKHSLRVPEENYMRQSSPVIRSSYRTSDHWHEGFMDHDHLHVHNSPDGRKSLTPFEEEVHETSQKWDTLEGVKYIIRKSPRGKSPL